jgi:hypothetical protein
MHVNLSWLKVEERLTSSLLVFVRGIDMLNAPSCLFELLAHSSKEMIVDYNKVGLNTSPFTSPTNCPLSAAANGDP